MYNNKNGPWRTVGPLLINLFMTTEYIAIVCGCVTGENMIYIIPYNVILENSLFIYILRKKSALCIRYTMVMEYIVAYRYTSIIIQDQ